MIRMFIALFIFALCFAPVTQHNRATSEDVPIEMEMIGMWYHVSIKKNEVTTYTWEFTRDTVYQEMEKQGDTFSNHSFGPRVPYNWKVNDNGDLVITDIDCNQYPPLSLSYRDSTDILLIDNRNFFRF